MKIGGLCRENGWEGTDIRKNNNIKKIGKGVSAATVLRLAVLVLAAVLLLCACGCGQREAELLTEAELNEGDGDRAGTEASGNTAQENPVPEDAAAKDGAASQGNAEVVSGSDGDADSSGNAGSGGDAAGKGSGVSPAVTEAPEKIFVDVCGAVEKPGVYDMEPDSRVFQAIEAAGGFLPGAAGAYINQAQALSDGQQIYVPTEEEIAEQGAGLPGNGSAGTGSPGDAENGSTSGAGTSGGTDVDSGGNASTDGAAGELSGSSGKVNLNTADAAALQTLTGIGESKASAILAYREEHGRFNSIEDIMNVPGIKESTFSKIKDKIAVE